jgi:hypothetical protein
MPEKIKGIMIAHRDTFAEWLFIHAITRHAQRATKDGDLRKVPGWEHLNESGEIEVSLKFDGVEVPFLQCMEDMDEQRERMVKEQAAELLEGKFRELGDMVYQMEQAVRAKAEELGLPMGKEEDW